MSEILVITCPSGKQCSHLIPLIYQKTQFKLRLAAHSHDSASKLQTKYPEAEVVVSDISSLDECCKLLSGATTVYHVGPSFHSRETEMGFNMINAAVAESQTPGNKFRHFVFSSVLCTQHRNLMQHDLKSRIEERLNLSPLNFTILQPTNFMDAYPVAALASQSSPSLERLWNPDVPNSMIALRDLAEAAARVLREGEPHYLAQYPLCSTLPISDTEVVKVIEKHTGKSIAVHVPSFETGVQNVLKFLFGGKQPGHYVGELVDQDFLSPAADGDLRPDITRDEAERLILFYNRRGLKGSPNVLRWLIQREPTTVDEWVQMQLNSTV
ncbi:hypothetical protein NUU61_004178 [Penicillium alfredii]|uniref:NmrA-like domain-containing protein n=1 Tax=Penicillium alfredii TaxID=1506179 RepID=A0A9W9KDK6_9EURO|nr:uncharacterized protein NUU61_004178 [Penicillium alfredii]KAJ5101956.1 hypothetical protein NUU61_004178 [Penicillium alfredii]